MIDGKVQQVLLAARGLNTADLPSQSFVNRHIVYTHGYGVVASPSNAAEPSGNPDYLLKDVPTVASGLDLANGPPSQIYFAENLSSYVLTGAQSREFDFQREGATDKFTRYKGKDGVKLSNFVRRAAFALRFGSLDPLISGQINSDTKLLMERDIRARVTKLAPFLQFDADPYPVVLGDRTVWIMDGYTTSDRYPYGQSLGGEGSLSSSFNYVRNSVKVTVDAYEGTVNFYVFDKKDPIIKAYEEAFPDLFTDASRMPKEIRAHLRYPEDLVSAQSAMFGRYHVTEPKRFYDGSSKWLVSPDPGSGVIASSEISALARAANASTNSSNTPLSATSTGKRIDPFYLNIKLPGQDEHFIILSPFVPVSSGNSQTRLVSFLTANSDPDQYGQLQAYIMPTGRERQRPRAGEQRDPAHRLGVDGDHAPQPAGLERHPGKHAAHPGRKLDRVRAALLRAEPATRQLPAVPVRRRLLAGFRQRVLRSNRRGRPQPAARSDRDHAELHLDRRARGLRLRHHDDDTTTTPGTATTTPATTAPTTTTVPPAGGSAQELLQQAADEARPGPGRHSKAGNLGGTSSWSSEARTLVKQAQEKQAAGG